MPADETRPSVPFSLRAENPADLEVISACLQDGLTRISDITYQTKKKRFALGILRFMWEKSPQVRKKTNNVPGERIQCGVHFDYVDSVKTQNIDQNHRQGLLPLLTITAREQEAMTEIVLTFAGGGAIRLQAECIDCHLQDIGASWPAKARPDHGLDRAETD